MKKLKVMSVFGTRPEAIKMAPLVQSLARRENVESLLCVTAQHRQMLDSVLEIFHLKPDYDLDIMEPRQTLTTITSKTLLGMEKVIEQAKPDLIFGAWRYNNHLCRRIGGVLSPGAHRPCGGGLAHLGSVFALPGGDESDDGGRSCNAALLSNQSQRRESAAGVCDGRGICHRQYRD